MADEPHLVARAQQLVAGARRAGSARRRARPPSASTRRRGHGGRGPRQTPRLAGGQRRSVAAGVGGERPGGGPDPEHLPAVPDRKSSRGRGGHCAGRRGRAPRAAGPAAGAAIDDAVGAAPPDDVPHASGQHAQLGGRATGACACARRSAGRCGPARTPPAQSAASGRIRGRAAVVEPGGGEVADAPPAARVAALPLLLFAAAAERLVEAPDPLDRARRIAMFAPHTSGTSRSSDPRSSVVIGGRLAAAGARSAALQTGADRAAEHLGSGAGAPPASSASSQPGGRVDVVVDEHDQVAGGGFDPGVAGGVGAPGGAQRDERARRGARRRALLAGRIAVVDDDHLGAGGRAPAAPPRRASPRGSPATASGDHDRGCGLAGHAHSVPAAAGRDGCVRLRARRSAAVGDELARERGTKRGL